MSKRKVELVVLSDIHLGTFGSRADEVLTYLQSVKPKTLVLNGDIIDVWQFKKKYWPNSHTKVLKEILDLAAKGTNIYFLPGNHDEVFRKFVGYKIGRISIENKLVMHLDGKKAWFFHGDVFDVTMQHSRWLTHLGSYGYDFLIWLNHHVNRLMKFMGKERKSFSKMIKNGVKSAISYINNFEELCADIAIDKGYDYVVCGHIHQPQIKQISTKKGKVTYLNSGDWIENLTALEYHKGVWKIFDYAESDLPNNHDKSVDKNTKELFDEMLKEFQLTTIKQL